MTRVATSGDIEAMVLIERASFSKPWSARSFRSLIESPAAIVLVAQRDTPEIRGYAVAYVAADVGELANIAVSQPSRGSGVGRTLLLEVIRRVGARGAASLFLDVRASNVVARRLYESESFAEIARRKDYYAQPVEDAIVMRRVLG
ncbi:MAG: ribosomal protein S18-alanine N-acetyltransferase [Gemmatimonadaceae bacterium]